MRFAFAIVLAVMVAQPAAAVIVDGTRVGDAYGSAVSVQTIQTGFGDNENEWNAAYCTIEDGKLFLMFTGNLQANFNKLEVFIDSAAGNTNVYPAMPGNDGSDIMAGMTFDTAFEPDYHMIFRRGFDQVDKFDVDIGELGTANFDSYFDIGAGFNDNFSANTGTGVVNASPMMIGFDNSNVAGIGGSAGDAADQAAAQAVETGLEIGIDLADIGSPAGPIKVMLLQNNDNHDFLSNQTLGGLPVGTDNLGSPAANVDFSALDGDQFFVHVPEPATFALGLIGLLWLIRRRR